MFSTELSATVMSLMIFLSTNREGLLNSATLLGGPVAGRRVLRLLDTLASQRQMTRWVSAELAALHRLLSLRDVGDFDRPEAYFFSLLHPEDPAVAEICLLTDGLTDCLKALQDETSFANAPSARAA